MTRRGIVFAFGVSDPDAYRKRVRKAYVAQLRRSIMQIESRRRLLQSELDGLHVDR